MSVQSNAEKRSLEKEAGGPDIDPVSEGTSVTLNDVDKAYQFAKEHHADPLTEADNRRILNKIDRHLLPLVRAPLFMLVTIPWCVFEPRLPARWQQAYAVIHRGHYPAGDTGTRMEHQKEIVC